MLYLLWKQKPSNDMFKMKAEKGKRTMGNSDAE